MAPPSTPDKFPSMDMFDTIVEVNIGLGANKKTYKLYKGALCFYSAYFDKALNGDFEEARNGVVNLPTESVSTFDRFVLWLYTRKIEDDDEVFKTFNPLIELWTFADRRDIPLLMNFCLDAIRDKVVEKWMVPVRELKNVYAKTTSKSGLRQFIIHVVGCTWDLKDDATNYGWPQNALWDFLRLKWDWDKAKKLGKDGVADLNMCEYHQHEEGVTCSKKRKREGD